MRNTIADLNNYLFEQLERLTDDDLTEDQLAKELKRSEGVSKVAEQILRTGELAYKTMTFRSDNCYVEKPEDCIPAILGGKNE